jgi:hypothetical protein
VTNPKGTRWETLGVNYLNEVELHAERTGAPLLDEADVHFGAVVGDGEWTLEFKDHQAITLPAYLDQLEASLARRAGIPFKGAVVVKARRQSVGDAYTVMRFERFRQLAAYVLLLEQAVGEMSGTWLPRPGELRNFLGETSVLKAELSVLFGEFYGPQEFEVQADGTEVPAGAEFLELATGCDEPGCICQNADIIDTDALPVDD